MRVRRGPDFLTALVFVFGLGVAATAAGQLLF